MREIEQGARRAGTKATAEYAAFGAYHRVARQVFDLRKGAGLTRRQLAAKSGVRQADINRIEAGDANPTLATVAALAYVLGADVALEPSRPLKAEARRRAQNQSSQARRLSVRVPARRTS